MIRPGVSPVPTATAGNPFSAPRNPWANDPRSGMQIVGDVFTGFGGGAGAVAEVQGMRAQQAAQGQLAQIVQQALAAGQDPVKAVMTSPHLSEIMSSPNWADELATLQSLSQPQQGFSGVLNPGDVAFQNGQQVAAVPPKPDLSTDAQMIVDMGGNPKNPDDWARLAQYKQSQTRPPQGPQPPAAVQTFDYIMRTHNLDPNDPKQFAQGVDLMQKFNADIGTQTNINLPTGATFTGRTEGGLPEMAYLPGSIEAEQRKAQAEFQTEGAKVIDDAIAAIQQNPGEFEAPGRIKQGARVAASTVEGLGEMASGIPAVGGIAGYLGKQAGALRTGPLAEPAGPTMDQVNASLGILARDLSRSGLLETDRGRQAQQEINYMREQMSAGGMDSTMAIRRLGTLRELMFGQSPQSTEAKEKGSAPGGATAPAAPQKGSIQVNKPAVQVNTQAEYDALAPGTLYRDSDGKLARKQ